MRKALNKLSIPQIIALGFLSTILVGAFLLSLPIMTQSGQATSFLDALFTATSAVCVTGQTTLNTAAHWNYLGKTVIITLIEVGGLGFMTILVIFFMFLGKKLNLRQRKIIQESLNLDSMSESRIMISYVIKFSILVQLIGALFLSVDFIPRLGIAKGIYYSVFHSISAFCNAGFDLFGDSMISFQENPYILLVISSLIIIGGFGFLVWRDVLTYRKGEKLLLHTKITLVATTVLLLTSFLLFTISEERYGTFQHLSLPHRLINYWFLSVTPRTAGYANLDYASLSPMGTFVTIILMFIGGSSGSTAGGVKVTTVAVLAIFIFKQFKGQSASVMKRQIPEGKIVKSFMIVVTGVMMVVLSSLILLITETIPPEFGIEYILVEVFSCFGTVGLTMGLTPMLTTIGKLVLIILMFSGRIGLMTFFLTFSSDGMKESQIRYPEGNILIG